MDMSMFKNGATRVARIFADGEMVLCKEEMPHLVAFNGRYYNLIGEASKSIAILRELFSQETHEVKYIDIIFDYENQTVDSTSDERVKNNVMRHNYRVLSDEEKEQMQKIKDIGLDFHEYIGTIGDSRELSLAKTKIEEAVMWAVKHVTG